MDLQNPIAAHVPGFDAPTTPLGRTSTIHALGTLERVVTKLLSSKESSIIAVCGMGGSGKSTLCRRVVEQFPKSNVFWFQTDWYCPRTSAERRRSVLKALEGKDLVELERSGNLRNWYNWPAIVSALLTLKNQGTITVSHGWEQRTGGLDLNFSVTLESPRVILCDGIFLLDPHISGLFDRIVLLETSPAAAARRRSARDAHRAAPSYLALKDELAKRFVEPHYQEYKGSADLVLST